MNSAVKISCLIPVYNEEKRLALVLDHATQWADEIIVANKQSTDATKQIAQSYGDKVRVLDIPFSAAGHEDTVALMAQMQHDWVFLLTASEIPTRALITAVKSVIAQQGTTLDCIFVPKRVFSFGVSSPCSPWYRGTFPFVVNKRTAIIRNVIHDNFHPRSERHKYVIPYSETCCVYHFTHVSVKSYMRIMLQYMEAEAEHCVNPDQKIADCFEEINAFQFKLKQDFPRTFIHYCAWPFYWLGTALFVWEKRYYAKDQEAVAEYYQQYKKYVLSSEWGKGALLPEPILAVNPAVPVPDINLGIPARLGRKMKIQLILHIVFNGTRLAKYFKI